MNGKKMELFLRRLMMALVVILIVFCIAFIYPHISDIPGESQIGYLKGFVKYPFELDFNNDSWYVSDWWTVGGTDPGYMTRYFNHKVKIHFESGSGRVLVFQIDVLE